MSKQTSYTKRPKHLTSICILRSWLRDVGIKTFLPDAEDHDLQVEKTDGTRLRVTLRDGEGVGFRVAAKAFTARRDDVALGALYSVQAAAGYEEKKPSLRDKNVVLNKNGAVRKHHYRDEDFLVVIRHNELRRAPNPPKETWKKYDSVMREAVWSFMRSLRGKSTCYDICLRHGYEMSDLLSYARLYVINFVGRSEIENPTDDDNEKLCYKYIQQRLRNDFLSVLLKKERSVLPDSQTAQIALLGSVNDYGIEVDRIEDQEHGGRKKDTRTVPTLGPSVDPTDAYIAVLDNDEILAIGRQLDEADEECLEQLDEFVSQFNLVKPRNRVLDISSAVARRRSAAKMLEELLAQMPHDRFVEVLTDTVENVRFDPGARTEATRRLRHHVADCAGCKENEALTLLLQSRQGSGTKTDTQEAAA